MNELPRLRFDLPPEFGPIYTTEFVIEWVGPKSVPASAACQLLDPRWKAALGEPTYWSMAPGNAQWQPLSGRSDGSYDSLAASWSVITPRGQLSSTAADHLLSVASQVGATIERKAMPMPVPADLTAKAAALVEAKDALDIGFSMAVAAPSGAWIEQEMWQTFKSIGLDLAPNGCFVWRAEGWPEPLVEVSPLGGAQGFSLAQAQAGTTHPGVLIGFSVPTNPDPMQSLDAAIRIAESLGGHIFDEDDRPWTAASGPTYRGHLTEAVKALTQAGFAPGSRAARELFA